MKILQLHGRSAKFGGASVHTEMLIRYLLRKGHEVFLVIPFGNEYLKEKFKHNDKVNYFELDTENVKKIFSNISFLFKLVKKNNIEVVHTHHRNADILGCFVHFFYTPIKVYPTIHGPYIEEQTFRNKIISKIHLGLIQKFSSGIAYISHFVRLSYSMTTINKCRYEVIHNGSEKAKIQNEVLFEKLIQRKKFVVTILCNISGYKRVDLFIEIAEKLKDKGNIEFWVVGDGDDRVKLECISNEKKLNVVFWGWTRDICEYISASDIIVSTAIEEGFGRTLTEALSLGKPIISFDSGGPREIISNESNGYLIPVYNTKIFSDKIEKLHGSPALYHEYSSNAFNTWINKFSPEIFGENYINFFTSND
jgi:glycosyltransferase involved in cell wall biosynthesis